MRRRQALAAFEPFVGYNPFRVGAGPAPNFVVALEAGDGYLCAEYQLGLDQVVSFAAKKDDFPGRYAKLNDEPVKLAKTLVGMALERGATLEAIQLLGTLVPLSRQQETTMAQANAKLSRNAADKEGLKNAAKKTPVAKETARGAVKKGGGGNSEALAKAREARTAAANVNRTYKVVAKKENGGREGTWTNYMIQVAQDNTDTDTCKAVVAKSKDYGHKKMDFKWLEEKGYIKF